MFQFLIKDLFMKNLSNLSMKSKKIVYPRRREAGATFQTEKNPAYTPLSLIQC